MEKGTKLNYYGKECEVIKSDLTHVVIKFKNGTIICTTKSTFAQTK
jgi:hypothetical protein